VLGHIFQYPIYLDVSRILNYRELTDRTPPRGII